MLSKQVQISILNYTIHHHKQSDCSILQPLHRLRPPPDKEGPGRHKQATNNPELDGFTLPAPRQNNGCSHGIRQYSQLHTLALQLVQLHVNMLLESLLPFQPNLELIEVSPLVEFHLRPKLRIRSHCLPQLPPGQLGLLTEPLVLVLITRKTSWLSSCLTSLGSCLCKSSCGNYVGCYSVCLSGLYYGVIISCV